MNLQSPCGNDISQTRNRSRNVAPYSGLCTRCLDSCVGNCEIFKSSLRGREVIYPEPFGELTAVFCVATQNKAISGVCAPERMFSFLAASFKPP